MRITLSSLIISNAEPCSMTIDDLRKILDWAEAYQEETGHSGPVDRRKLGQWLLEEEGEPDLPPQLDGTIAMYIGLMYNYAIFYSRRVFKDSPIYSLVDFGFMAALLPNLEKTKSQLIQENIMEKSSGTEVIKRLLKQGMFEESANPADKRTKLVRLTPLGLKAFYDIGPSMEAMSKVITGEMGNREKVTLLETLKKLFFHHWDLFTQKKEAEIQEMLSVG